ncbi:hypothetical protein D0869_04228 [Hortaea werneckii]|uniref:FAD-binding domain-containing protein n=1 Tax=Hortaea werneckii TaxID=91943 RepID=A0A3M6X2A1_HORWE|nr:hypothetical protein KC334_g2003 [Hortaea werneckii]KAI7024433.1 hypothetical protein KC355_g1406 [Hortaea werneckii]KAI7197246.1 hypothetical protein KC324_g4267 [Hortaea werneckii]KAI7588833.1 hypothetical protein KC316_g4269 [Hortaea werneckii]KAI7673970.1 hypothetical protein KC318_g1894 [Hortaea werneckii]
MSATAPIAIVGGGPAGLTLGRLLEIHKIDFIIFERDVSPQPANARTGTLDLHAENGLLALQEAGLMDEFAKLARWDTPTILARSTGELIVTLNEDGGANRPEIDRKALRSMLLDSIPPERICWGCKVYAVKRRADSLCTIEFSDGRVWSGFRLVVGADGAWSKVRSLITDVKPVYSGMHYLSSEIPLESPFHPQTEALVGKGTYMALGGGQQLVGQRLGNGSYFVGVGLHLPEAWDVKANLADPSAFRHELVLNDFKEFADQQKDLILHSEGAFYSWPLYELPKNSLRWEHIPGATLIGDAAHLCIPSGEGVNVAMHDALQLAQYITEYGLHDLDRAVAEYEKQMFPRAIATAEDAEQSKNLWAPDSPNGFLRSIGMEV